MTLQGICQVLMGSALVVAMAGSAVAQEHVVGQTGPGALYALDMPDGMERRPGRLRPRHRGSGAAGGAAVRPGQLHIRP